MPRNYEEFIPRNTDLIRKIKYWWNCQSSGLEELADDLRDLHFSDLFNAPYVKKDTGRKLLPYFVKDQKSHENCAFQAWSNNLSGFFGVNVSARWLTAKAYQEGLCAENGRANLRAGAKVAQKWGVVFEKDCPSDESYPWEIYKNIDFKNLEPLAKENKIPSYYRIDTIDEYLEAIDRGYAVTLGRKWTTDMNAWNMTDPWIIPRTGFSVGGHSTCGIGYSGDNTTEVNSYSERYGDKGLFHCPLKDLQKDIDTYGAFAIVPVPYTPKDVKIKTLIEQIKSLMDKLKTMLNASNILYATAKGLIGQNLAPKWQPLGCSASICYIINKAFGENIDYPHTDDLLRYLKASVKWQQVDDPQKGDIIISPTGEIPDYSPLAKEDWKRHGHCFIAGQYNSPDGSIYLMSNNGEKEKEIWDTHWTLKKATDYFVVYGKVPTYYFRRIG